MNSTIMIQKGVKDLAAQRAKIEGLSLSTVTRFLLKGYADGKLNIGLIVEPDVDVKKVSLDTKTQEQLNTSVEKWRHKFAQ